MLCVIFKIWSNWLFKKKKKKDTNRLDKIEKLFDWVGQMSHFTEWKRDGCDVFKEKVTANRGGEGMKLMADGKKPQCVWLGGRRHWAVSSLKLIFFFFFHWERGCAEQMECRAGDGGADEDPHFDKLRFGEPHGCYETHSVFKGRLKRSLDHSFETVPGTVRHWRQAHTDTARD